MDEKEMALLLQIARCPVISQYVTDGLASPCSRILDSQGSDGAHGRTPDSVRRRQVPEPWSGHLGSAPILFLSSNPSISYTEAYPRGAAGDQELVAFFSGRFDQTGPRPWIRDGIKNLNQDGSYSAPVQFWMRVKARAGELLERPAVPGHDYALSEVVHCKSKAEDGVWDARNNCARRHLGDLLAVAGARLVVILGEVAAATVRDNISLAEVDPAWDRLQRDSRGRCFLFLPHPNARVDQQLTKTLPPDLLAYVRNQARS